MGRRKKTKPAPAPPTDRGRARRDAILEAAIEVVASKGAGAVTHRAVAAEAGVPLAATTYYFSSKAELLVEAFRHLTQDRMRAYDEALSILPERMSADVAAAAWANALAVNLRSEPARVLSEFEMHLEASRQPELRLIHEAWEAKAMTYFTAGMKAIGSSTPETDAALVLSVLTGLEIGEIASPTRHAERDLLAPLLRRLLHALVPTD